MDSQTIQRRRWWILGVVVIGLLMVVLDNTVLNVAMKVIADPREGLGATQSQLQWAINSYTLVFAGLLFTAGVLGDRIGRKRLMFAGMAVFGIASLISAYAGSPDQLIGARALMGLGGALVMPQTLSIISNVFEPQERARAIGIWAGAVGLGIAIGPTLGGLLLDHFWWGSVFLINVPVVAIGMAALLYLVPESRNPKPGKLDPLGVFGSIAGLVLLTYGIIKGGQVADWTDPQVLGYIAAGIVVLAGFVAWEAHTDHPSLDVRLFKNPRFSAAVGIIALTFFALAGVVFFVNFYLQSVRGYTPLDAGLLVVPLAAAQLIFAPRSAGLVRRFGAKNVSAGGLLLVALGLASFSQLGQTTPIAVLEVIFFVMGSGMAVVMPAATESIMSALPREHAGSGSAVQNTVRQTGTALGVAVLGSVVSTVYHGHMASHLRFLPPAVRDQAGNSIESTMAVVQRLGGAGARLVEPAKASFVTAMHVSAMASGLVMLAGVIVAALWMPDTRQPAPSTEDVFEVTVEDTREPAGV